MSQQSGIYVSVPTIGGVCPTHSQPLGTCCGLAARVRYVNVEPTSPTISTHAGDLLRAQDELRRRATAARAVAREIDDPRSPRAAALRGKAKAYQEAADLIESVLRGGRQRQKWSPRRGR